MSVAIIIITIVALIYFRKVIFLSAKEVEKSVEHLSMETEVVRTKRSTALYQELNALDEIKTIEDVTSLIREKKIKSKSK